MKNLFNTLAGFVIFLIGVCFIYLGIKVVTSGLTNIF